MMVSSLFALSLCGLFSGSLALTINSQNESSLCASNSRQIVHNSTDIWPWQSYYSSNITPPYLQINRTGKSLAPGLLFIGQENGASGDGVHQVSPFIIRDDNELVWGGPTGDSTNFRQQTLYSQSIISFWVGSGGEITDGELGHGWGKVVFYDLTYKLINTICLQLNLTLPTGGHAECDADLHESLITEDNTILLTAYNVTQADLTSVGGPSDGWVYDCLAVEVDIRTGEVLFLWSALEHVPVNRTKYEYTETQGVNRSTAYDWFHINSIQKHEGNYLINSRHLWETFLVDSDGQVIWYIDGADGGDFGSLPDNITYSWQHMARITTLSSTQSLLTYFANDDDSTETSNPSKGLAFLLTLPPNPSHPPKLVHNFWDKKNPVSAASQGAFTPLVNGNYLVGYGGEPFIKEFDSHGELVWSAQFAGLNQGQSYRAYKQEWHATPYTKPSVVVRKIAGVGSDELSACADSDLRGYVSWNGATDVTGYVIYAGTSEDSLREIGRIQKKGFETQFSLPGDVEVVQVGAVEGSRVVRKSDVVFIE